MHQPITDLPEATKVCRACGGVFARSTFPTAKVRGRLTVRSWCRDCLLAYYRRYYRQKRHEEPQ